MICHNGTLLGSRIDPVINASSNRSPPMISALLELPRFPKALLLYGGNKEIVIDFWFCPDDIECCIKSTKHSWIIDWPQVPDVWPILSGTNLTCQKIKFLLQDAGFKL